ncbi:DNA-3-methyladenine glycosylase family protein [Rosettibacter firmus]|uniref:DNA-3-methyladenine glycosylase family protein n=1 Tax=Rosettibacter firmus TaxID=3111522 RepID=UPI00336BC8BD
MLNNEIEKAIQHLSKNDPVLSALIQKFGTYKIETHKKYFFDLLRAIIGQQLSMKAAASIEKKFMTFFKNKPTPELILETENTHLRALGLSNSKVIYIKDLSEKIITKRITLNRISEKSDEEIINELTQVKGIGIWTVHMFLIFTLGRLNVLPYTDLGIRKAVVLNYGLKKLPDEIKLKKLAKDKGWHPYCSVASIYLWKSLNNKNLD